MSKFTKEQIEEKVVSELDEALETMGGFFDGSVVEINEEEKTITVKFSYNEDEDEDYVGLYFN